MPRALRTCTTPGCGELTTGGRCSTCEAQADAIRGTPTQRGYTSTGHTRFRRAVLRRDPICVADGCHAPATVADHYPASRRELTEQGLNPNDPTYGRGLCKRHHDQATAQAQPGGWNG